MLIKKYLILFLVFIYPLIGQSINPFIKIDFPHYTGQNQRFQSSLILNQPEFDFTHLKIKITSDKNFVINNASLKRHTEVIPLILDRVSRTEKVILINYEKGSELLASQVMLNLICDIEGTYKFNFDVEYFYNNEEIFNWSSDDFNNSKQKENQVEVLGNSKNNSAKFNKGFNFSFKDIFNGKVNLFQFWFKLDSIKAAIFNLINNYGDTLLSINSNKLQFLEILKADNQIDFSQSFISINSWYKISFVIDNANRKLLIFLNDKLFSTVENIDNSFIAENSIKLISNNSITIDEITFGKAELQSFENNDFNSIESYPIKQFSFNENSTVQLKFSNSAFKYVKNGLTLNDVNIDLQVNRFDTYIELTWEKSRFKDASYFMVEKSFNGTNFIELSKVLVMDDKNNYNYVDYLSKENDISYYRIVQVNKDSSEVFSNNIKIGTGLTNVFDLKPNYPNPFNPVTQISVEMYESSEVEIAVFDVVGKRIVTLFEGTLSQGIYNFQFDGSNFPSGLYFCEVKTPLGNQVQKMLLAK